MTTENADTKENVEMTEEEIISVKENYFESLRNWIHQVQMSQANAYLPYYFMAYQMLFHMQPPPGTGSYLNNNYQHQGQWPYHQLPPNPNMRPQIVLNVARNNGGGRQGAAHGTDQLNRPAGLEFFIPPIWKRFIAELLDFGFIFISKSLIQYITVDYLGLLDFNKFSISNTVNLLKQITEDQDVAFELTSEIFMLELLNRLGSCFFETIFLSDTLGGPILGATPGKVIMGLRVVFATSVVPVENRARETVLVYPGSNLTFGVALLRSIIKNAFITLVFPLCMFFLFFQHNRTTYDVLCNVIVVESEIIPLHRRQ